MSHRIPQLNELIRQEISALFLKEFTFPPDCLVTISEVATSRDLSQAKVSVSVLPASEREAVLELLKKRAGFIQFSLGKRLIIRKIPKVIFELDLSQEKASHIDTLIDKIHEEG